MTLKEYDENMSEYAERLDSIYGKEWDVLYEEVSRFQHDYMVTVLEEYKKRIDCKAREHIYNLLHHAVHVSESGNSIIDVKTEEEADAIDNIVWEDIGDYLLDCEIYEDKDGSWEINCMFAGNYVPYWDGWDD